jgi:hypothetical protein
MAISYPLSLPTVSGIRAVEFRAVNAVAYSASPFTFAGQAHAYPGQMWQADVTLAPMRDRADAEEWNAFLLSLRGQFGTFLLGDPNGKHTARHSDLLHSSRGLLGRTRSAPLCRAGQTLLAGDYIQSRRLVRARACTKC